MEAPTAARVHELAPDARVLRAARDLALPERWARLEAGGGGVWGELQGSGAAPYHVEARLDGPAVRCSCPSRKQPCKHGLALLLLAAEQPERFSPGEPAPSLATWLAGHVPAAERPAPAEPADPEAVARRAAEREAAVAAGVAELERWLGDVARTGLAAAQAQPYAAWDAVAARMVDAKAPGLARQVRAARAASLGPGEGLEALLERLGLLALLLAAYARLDELPAGLAAEVRTLLGWTQSQDELRAAGGVRDRWAVLGQVARVNDDRLRTRRSWLAGADTGRLALVLEFAFGERPFDARLRAGRAVDAELAFFAGAPEQRAVLVEAPTLVEGADVVGVAPGHPGWEAALAAYAAQLAESPWQERVALALADVLPEREGGRFALRDVTGAVAPLDVPRDDGLRLLALAAGRPLWVFGEWDGRALRALAAQADGRHVALAREAA